MSRAILVLSGLGFLAWSIASFIARDFMSARMGLQLQDGDGIMEFMAINCGLVSAIGIFAILGSILPRLRVSAILMLLVFGAGVAGGRVFGMASGAEPGAYTYTALAIEFALIALASIAFVIEKRDQSSRSAALSVSSANVAGVHAEPRSVNEGP